MFYDVIGWIGTALLVLAYFLVSTKKLSATSLNYQLMNLIGAFCAAVNFWAHKAYPGIGIEIFWSSISVYALYQILRGK